MDDEDGKCPAFGWLRSLNSFRSRIILLIASTRSSCFHMLCHRSISISWVYYNYATSWQTDLVMRDTYSIRNRKKKRLVCSFSSVRCLINRGNILVCGCDWYAPASAWTIPVEKRSKWISTAQCLAFPLSNKSLFLRISNLFVLGWPRTFSLYFGLLMSVSRHTSHATYCHWVTEEKGLKLGFDIGKF